MKAKSTCLVPFRRRREGKTNYKKRVALVKSGLPRLCVRKSNRYVIVQLIEFRPAGDNVLASASSRELGAFGWLPGKNLPSAYLTGVLAASRAKKAGCGKAILDIGFNTPVHGSRVFAALGGAVDAGLEVKFEEKALPSEDRASGKHVEEFAKSLGKEQLEKRFSNYLKRGINVGELTKVFNEAKEKILREGEKK
jgi:large subunit ribosomal protein L18